MCINIDQPGFSAATLGGLFHLRCVESMKDDEFNFEFHATRMPSRILALFLEEEVKNRN